MSCLDVMYRNYGAHHYLPSTAAATAYKAAYYHHHHQQQKRFAAYSRMQDCVDVPPYGGHSRQAEKPRGCPKMPRAEGPGGAEEGPGGAEEARCKEMQPAEAEYLSSRCVLFTYFHGDIEDVVDEHFSRALSQPSAFTNDTKGNRLSSGALWKDGGSLSEGQCSSSPSSLWSSSYPSQISPCITTVHSDFSHTAAFHSTDAGIWSGSVTQPGLPSSSGLTDNWPYSLGSQGGTGYSHVHEMYPHVHPRQPHPHTHTHAMLHHSHSTTLDPRFNPLLLPRVRASCSTSTSAEGLKTELEPSGPAASSWPAVFHGTVDIYDTALDQEKAKASVWF
ncbi:transcription cofactor vestigial-like protein 3 [Brachyhypopomus gauderio]|uniref:transcription cofactor vestigial-like protein 3 n=1 Tax=Brachyhypopomus gauderio TaxID=698409 RepID=UPI0040431514